MAKNNKNGLVYSTDKEWFEGLEIPLEDAQETLSPSKQKLKIFTDRLKGNKLAIRITGFSGTEDELEALAKELKQACGVGGSAKNGEIILQGDCKSRAGDYLTKKGFSWKLAGG